MYKFKFADIAEGLETGKVIEIFVKEGQKIEDGDDLFSVETEKVNTEIGSPVDGVIHKILMKEGEEIEVGQVVMIIDDGSGDDDSDDTAATTEAEEPIVPESSGGASVVGDVPISDDLIPSRTVAPKPAPSDSNAKIIATPVVRRRAKKEGVDLSAITGTGPNGKITTTDLDNYLQNKRPSAAATPTGATTTAPTKVKASPAVRRAAKNAGIDLTQVKGTGPGGRITSADLASFQSVPPSTSIPTAPKTPPMQPATATPSVELPPFQPHFVPSEPLRREPMTGIRKAIARQMSLAKRTIPETTLMREVNMDKLIKMRAELKEEAANQGVKLTFMAFFIKAVAMALQKFPILNCSLDADANEIIYKNFYNVGIAVDSPTGLMVPVIKNADQKSILRIAAEVTDLAAKVRNRTIKMNEMQEGTFSISNFGSVGIEYATPVINYPESGILGIGSFIKRAIINDKGEVVPGTILPVSLTIDHRTIDGADGGRFLHYLKSIIENPVKLVL